MPPPRLTVCFFCRTSALQCPTLVLLVSTFPSLASPTPPAAASPTAAPSVGRGLTSGSRRKVEDKRWRLLRGGSADWSRKNRSWTVNCRVRQTTVWYVLYESTSLYSSVRSSPAPGVVLLTPDLGVFAESTQALQAPARGGTLTRDKEIKKLNEEIERLKKKLAGQRSRSSTYLVLIKLRSQQKFHTFLLALGTVVVIVTILFLKFR